MPASVLLRNQNSNLQGAEDDVELLLAEDNVRVDFAKAVDRVQTHGINLVVEHVDQKVQGRMGELRTVQAQFANGIHGSVADLCSEEFGGGGGVGAEGERTEACKQEGRNEQVKRLAACAQERYLQHPKTTNKTNR